MMKLNSKKGITLIALVITIIVMLILAAVTINMATHGGLFGYAGNSTGETRKARDEEQKLGVIPNNLTTNDLIEKFTTVPNIHSWTREGDTFTCSHCNASYTMGEQVNYTPNTNKTSTTVSGTDSGIANAISDGKLNPTAYGFNEAGDQPITRDTNLAWIVLGVDKNGVLLITSDKPTTSNLLLHGKKAYINGPDILNRVCEELYSNTTYGKARSINVDDVNLALEYTDTRGMVTSVSGNKYRVDIGTKLGDIGTGKMAQTDWDEIKHNTQTPEAGKVITDYEINGYQYSVAGVENINSTRQQTIICAGNIWYWMASRGVCAHCNSSNKAAIFALAGFQYGTMRFNITIYDASGCEYRDGLRLRPVVPLKSELPAKVN